VGLASREIEAAGISTLCLSMIPELTSATGAPRVAGLEYPLSRPMGLAGDATGQSAVLRAALAAFEAATRFGEVVELPFRWPEPRGQAMGSLPQDPPIGALCKKKPWLFLKLLSGEIPDAEPAS
jgi:D-proline reductase (dithiol) PrdB